MVPGRQWSVEDSRSAGAQLRWHGAALARCWLPAAAWGGASRFSCRRVRQGQNWGLTCVLGEGNEPNSGVSPCGSGRGVPLEWYPHLSVGAGSREVSQLNAFWIRFSILFEKKLFSEGSYRSSDFHLMTFHVFLQCSGLTFTGELW